MSNAGYESGLAGDLLSCWRAVFERQRAFAEHALAQLDDEAFFAVPSEPRRERELARARAAVGDHPQTGGTPVPPRSGLNSVAVIARHMGENMLSRWTDFLTTDGEKDTRDRDAELAPFPEPMTPEQRRAARVQVMDVWVRGWATLLATFDSLTEADLSRTVTIRGAPHAVHAAIARQIDHYAFHVGQINVIARQLVGTDRWAWFTLAPGTTREFNERMRREHGG